MIDAVISGRGLLAAIRKRPDSRRSPVTVADLRWDVDQVPTISRRSTGETVMDLLLDGVASARAFDRRGQGAVRGGDEFVLVPGFASGYAAALRVRCHRRSPFGKLPRHGFVQK